MKTFDCFSGDRYGRIRKVAFPSKEIIVSQKNSTPAKAVVPCGDGHVLSLFEDGLMQSMDAGLQIKRSLHLKETVLFANHLKNNLMFVLCESGVGLLIDLDVDWTDAPSVEALEESLALTDMISTESLPTISFPGSPEMRKKRKLNEENTVSASPDAEDEGSANIVLTKLDFSFFKIFAFRISGSFQCSTSYDHFIALAGDNTKLRIFEISKSEESVNINSIFVAKNPPNNDLKLPEEVKPRSLQFINEDLIAMGLANGRVLVFDIELRKKQPILSFQASEDQRPVVSLTSIFKSSKNTPTIKLFTGDTRGAIGHYELYPRTEALTISQSRKRKLKLYRGISALEVTKERPLGHEYINGKLAVMPKKFPRGTMGSIEGMAVTPDPKNRKLVVLTLGKFLHVFNTKSAKELHKVYIKSSPTCICLNSVN